VELSEVMYEYCEQEKLTRNEGESGVRNLCRLLNAMGYKDSMYFGQFHQQGSYGDLINFLEDNSGCVEAIKEWIAEQNVDEWKESLESHLNMVSDDPDEADIQAALDFGKTAEQHLR